ncbi:MAG: lytic transglycosylase domain-containing protein [Epsilonproteobacteria bacterium]|nr:lytic transglycosylase domain-containing protein [Campylobacterota bacterium]
MIKLLCVFVMSVGLNAATGYELFFDRAGRDFGIDPTLLKRIATIESGMNPDAINHNKNGTIDIGLMQINTIHLRRLSTIGITRESLKDPEVNIYVAALLLSSHIRKRGYNLDAIGCYHSGNPIYKNRWLKRLAMAQIPRSNRSVASGVSSDVLIDDPRSRFAQSQLLRRTDENIARGMDPKTALREAQRDVDRLMGYTS